MMGLRPRGSFCQAMKGVSIGVEQFRRQTNSVQFAVAQTGIFYLGYGVWMKLRTYQFCLVARELAAIHGSYFAAVFLFENGIAIEADLAILASR